MPMTATPEEYQELIALLDDVFFSKDSEKSCDFITLLPKLYQEQYCPWENNYVVREGKALKAAVGMYITETQAAGEMLRCGGIGNVAVAKDSRGKGYMKEAMDAAMKAMRDAGCDFGELGGHRHRYQYWGFEHAGVKIRAGFTRNSVRHAYGKMNMDAFRLEEPAAADLPELQALIERAPLHAWHDPAAFGDILRSWASSPRIVRQAGDMVAYFAIGHDSRSIKDLQVFRPAALPGILNAVFTVLPEDVNSFDVPVPLWEKEFLAGAEFAAEWLHLEEAGQFTVLHWERVLRALLQLQCGLKPLPDGTLAVKIHGNCGEESLRLHVKNNQSFVEPYTGTPDLELQHLEAIRFFLGPVSILRISPLACAWFPLPLFLYRMDGV